MHRRTDLWGPDGAGTPLIQLIFSDIQPIALEFDPDRFLDDRIKIYLNRNPFMFLPFNGGPRICVGQQVSIYLFIDGCRLKPQLVCL